MRINFLYIDRNILEKGLCIPGGYPWGAAYLHCSILGKYLRGIPATSLTKHKLALMAGTRTPIPPHWQFHPELGLLPEGFVDNNLFNRLFPTPKDYQTRLVKEYEAFVKLGRAINESVVLSEQEVKDIADRLAQTIFPGKRITSLSNDEKGKLCVRLETQFNLTYSQIADILSMPEYLVRQLLTSKDYGRKKW